jgi:hypothetical protein
MIPDRTWALRSFIFIYTIHQKNKFDNKAGLNLLPSFDSYILLYKGILEVMKLQFSPIQPSPAITSILFGEYTGLGLLYLLLLLNCCYFYSHIIAITAFTTRPPLR